LSGFRSVLKKEQGSLTTARQHEKNKGEEDQRSLDPHLLMGQLGERYDALRRAAGSGRLELYRRTSITLRVDGEPGSAATSSRIGREDGTAIRFEPADGRVIRFAAASGCSSSSLRWAAANVRPLKSIAAVGDGDPWPRGPIDQKDHDPVDRLPSPAEVGVWLVRARSRLAEALAEAGPVEAGACWTEVAATVESLVADEGLRCSRTRMRGWAMAGMRSRDAALATPRPLFVASRSWNDLDEAGWAELVASRWLRAGALAGQRQTSLPVLFTAEAAAWLVPALVQALNRRVETCGAPVGAGWEVTDDPRAAGALLGGRSDDAGFDTRRRVLADGIRVIGPLTGPGTLRRPSFRDPPQPLPSHLSIAPGEERPFRKGLIVSEVALYPMPDGAWILECDGVLLRGNEPALLVRGGRIRTTPGQMVQRCVERIGPAHASQRGTRTPALLFDGLAVSL